ncbi:MAG: low molecular weight phosphotyrosine protein phosphatase [Ruminococcaceae bacterium]|nr:low molecular weight phosphotyrosine protein phosphatase [Oscillospiraceae bacterium]
MFVCHGNICRSPMAECIMGVLLAEAGLDDRIKVASCATSSEEIWNGVGNPIYPPAVAELMRHGIDVPEREAVQLKKSDYDKYDLFIGMDSANVRNMHRIFGGDPQDKIRKLLSFADDDGDVADPWYTGCFDKTYRDIRRGCEGLLKTLEETV